MGNSVNIQENNNDNQNLDSIIENDCYEEIDIRKINKIKEQEKNWNENSIVYKINDSDMININNNASNSKNDKTSESKDNNVYMEYTGKLNTIQEEKNEKSMILENPKKEEENNNDNNINQINQEEENDSKIHLKIQVDKPKIRPINTRDEALNSNNNLNGNKYIRKKGNENEKNMEKKNELKGSNNYQSKKIVDINKIISEERLAHLKDNGIIYSGYLDKIFKKRDIKEAKEQKNQISYVQRFCVLTKTTFSYYKSKESFIISNKPIFSINNCNIKRIESATLGNTNFYFGIICEINEEIYKIIDKSNSFITNGELLVGFRSNEYKNMIKWVTLLNYFTNKI